MQMINHENRFTRLDGLKEYSEYKARSIVLYLSARYLVFVPVDWYQSPIGHMHSTHLPCFAKNGVWLYGTTVSYLVLRV
jgi:hypothetical protein